MEPFSLGALGALALGEGVKFLYNQAGEILKRRRERKDAEKRGEEAPTQPTPVETPSVVTGTLGPITVDTAAADELAGELKALRAQLADYADGIEEVDPSDDRVLGATSALRDAIESIIGQRITFEGEQREPTGTPVVTGKVSAKEIRARVSGIEMDKLEAGRFEGVVDADLIDSGSDVAAVRIGNKRGDESR